MRDHFTSSGKRCERNSVLNYFCIDRVFFANQGGGTAPAHWLQGQVSPLCTGNHCHWHCTGQTGSKRTQERITASTAEKPQKACRAGLCVHASMRGKTGNDHNTQPHFEYGTIRNGNVAVGQELRRLDQRSTKAGLGPSAPRTGITVLLELCMRLNT